MQQSDAKYGKPDNDNKLVYDWQQRLSEVLLNPRSVAFQNTAQEKWLCPF